MQLDLAFGPKWRFDWVGGLRVYAAPDFALVPDVFFDVAPLVPRHEVYVDGLLLQGLPEGLELRREPSEPFATTTGWPVTLYHVTAHDETGAVRERRMLAIYDIVVLAGIVRVRSSSETRFAAHRERILELLASARANLEGEEPAAIAELWDMTR
jgi:hypothetical protein